MGFSIRDLSFVRSRSVSASRSVRSGRLLYSVAYRHFPYKYCTCLPMSSMPSRLFTDWALLLGEALQLTESISGEKKSSHCTRQRPGIWNATNDNCPETQMHIYRVSVCKTLIVTFLYCTYIQSCHRAILNFPEMAIAAVRSLALRACATF